MLKIAVCLLSVVLLSCSKKIDFNHKSPYWYKHPNSGIATLSISEVGAIENEEKNSFNSDSCEEAKENMARKMNVKIDQKLTALQQNSDLVPLKNLSSFAKRSIKNTIVSFATSNAKTLNTNNNKQVSYCRVTIEVDFLIDHFQSMAVKYRSMTSSDMTDTDFINLTNTVSNSVKMAASEYSSDQ